MREEKKINRNLIIGAVVAVVVIIGLVVGLTMSGGDQTNENSAPETDTTATNPPSESGSEGEGAKYDEIMPGAYLGNDQRHWPRENPYFIDDAEWGDPGSYHTDFFGRPLWVPRNHNGDLPEKSQKKDAPGQCNDVELKGKTQQQYVNGRFMAVNEFAGPFAFDYSGAFPEQYAHSPAGAIIAAFNAWSYGWENSDDVGVISAYHLWDSPAMDELAKKEFDNYADIQTHEVPVGYKLVSCSEDIVVVELQTNSFEGERDTTGTVRLPMVWKKNMWVATLSASDEKTYVKADVPKEDVEDFTGVNLK